MKRYTAILITLLFCTVANALEPTAWNPKYQAYIDKYKDLAIAEMMQYNIPASITLAQGVLESGAGFSELTLRSNNHFGIKCHGWKGKTTYQDDDEEQECFRVYDTAYDSYEDHSKFLKNSPRYSRLFRLKRTDYKGWAYGLKECGYATNPRYPANLIGIIETYHLDQYDRAKSYNVLNWGQKHPGNLVVSHVVKMCNKRYYTIAKAGDTFKSIGKEFDVSARKLAKYNERDKKDVLKQGDIVFLQKKRRRADKIFKNKPHIVKAGQSLYDISQMYGVRLKKLIKKNHMDDDLTVRPGQQIIVY